MTDMSSFHTENDSEQFLHLNRTLILVVECSERTVLSCLELICLRWRRFGRYFSYHLAKSEEEECLHPCVDQAVRPLPLKSLNILADLTLELYSLCITVIVAVNIWTLWFVFRIFCVASLERFVFVGISRNVKNF